MQCKFVMGLIFGNEKEADTRALITFAFSGALSSEMPGFNRFGDEELFETLGGISTSSNDAAFFEASKIFLLRSRLYWSMPVL